LRPGILYNINNDNNNDNDNNNSNNNNNNNGNNNYDNDNDGNNSKKNLMVGSNIVGAVQLNLLYYHLFECTGNSA